MTRLPNVLSTDDLPLAELCAARLDGDVGALHGAFVPIDAPDVPALRAGALAIGIDRSLILDRRSAAWVHGAIPAPPYDTQLCRSAAARGTAQPGTRGVRELVIAPGELVDFEGVRCTSRARTAFDLLRDPNEASDEVEQIVARLIASHDGLERELRARLQDSVRLPYRALASARLERALARAQPSATR
ncbi:hypothetical protein [Agromyces aerolatus]|uniref:hypothetical protein n=1 Tax=Agromyces sp. LY-1074 TaxID=3074080 RepID=UPI002867762A|nr:MULTISPECIES: hypothetical protein [unclassified Agromyces]MDR5700609.1 hypothetical protein [Agromyces sp. LY-1074]MDR5707130.1 hypothetical protein [Agromyces sp. LY-1358]